MSEPITLESLLTEILDRLDRLEAALTASADTKGRVK